MRIPICQRMVSNPCHENSTNLYYLTYACDGIPGFKSNSSKLPSSNRIIRFFTLLNYISTVFFYLNVLHFYKGQRCCILIEIPNGQFNEGKFCFRFKADVSHSHINDRKPILNKIICYHMEQFRNGKTWKKLIKLATDVATDSVNNQEMVKLCIIFFKSLFFIFSCSEN